MHHVTFTMATIGDIIQAVPSHRLSRNIGVHPYNIYKQLHTLNPSRYMFYVDCGGFQIVGSSPELLVRVNKGILTNHPIAGTRPRGKTKEEDDKLEVDLLSDEKERAEHIMLVDLGRNDVNRVAEPITTKVDSLMHIERYSHVMHIVSQVSGSLREGCTPFDAFRSIFPAGTVSGAPKIKAMELIGKLEKERRGVYGGSVGYFSFTGDIDTCIAIRTLVVKDGVAYLQAGGGIVYDSVPYTEYIETVNKMKALEKAIDKAEKDSSKSKKSNKRKISNLNNHNTKRQKADPELDKGSKYHLQMKNITPPLPLTTNSPQIKPNNPQVKKKDILLIDNYDSFTFNLYQYLCQLGVNVIVHRNDKITLKECKALKPDAIVVSPGPGWPGDSCVALEVIRYFTGKIPVLGVCLGHEAVVEVFGGKIVHCGEIVHGKTSRITHDGKGIYKGIPNNFEVIRYHSLAASRDALPKDFIVTAETVDSHVIMGIRHKKYTVEGVQYHPESIKTEYGKKLLQNFLDLTSAEWSEEDKFKGGLNSSKI